MAIDARFAENLCTMLGGHEAAPCFSNMLRTAKRLARKRSITQTEDQDVVADRATILLDTSRKFSAPNLEGHQRLDMFERFLDAIDKRYMKRSLGQREFHRAFLIACLPHIVGEGEWEKHRSSFLQRYDEDEFKAEVLVTTPRRFGKTTAVAMFVAALLTCCPRMWISIFSTGKRASKSLLQQIKEVIDSIPNLTQRITSSNVEELWLQPLNTQGQKAVSRCFSYPSSVKVEYIF